MSNTIANPILAQIYALAVKGGQKVVTAKDAGTNAVYLARLESQGLVERAGHKQTGKRGRPAVQVKLTKRGRDRGRRAAVTLGLA